MYESLVRFTACDPAGIAGIDADRGHRLVWTLFAQEGAQRDFLYQPIADDPFAEPSAFRAVIRSVREPLHRGGWILRTRPFAPRLDVGQVLAFRVECVPSIWRPSPRGENGKSPRGVRENLVAAVRRLHPDLRTNKEAEEKEIRERAHRWLKDQGGKHGFAVVGDDPSINIHDRVIRRVGRRDQARRAECKGPSPRICFASFVFEGHLQVTDMDRFTEALRCGLGAEKAFGFGLVQIAPPRAGAGL